MQTVAFRKLRSLLIGSFMLGITLSPALGQSVDLLIQGTVLDSSHGAVVGAEIVITREGARDGQSTTTNSKGEFSFNASPGPYTLRIAARGFVALSQSIDLRTDSQPREFVLEVAPIQQTITVTESGGYQITAISSATRTSTPLLDVPQSIAVVTREQIQDQLMQSIGDVTRYVPGVTAIQGENNRDQLVIRGNSSSADFFLNGVRDDVQYYRDVYNMDRMEVLKGPNALIFGRGGGGGVVNRVTKQAAFMPSRQFTILGGSNGNKRITGDFDSPLNERYALRLTGMLEDSGSFRNHVELTRVAFNPTFTIASSSQTTVTLSYEYLRDTRGSDRGIPSFQGKPADVDISTFYGNPEYNDVWAYVNLATASVEHRTGTWTIRNSTMFGDYDRGYQNFVPGAVNSAKTSVPLTVYNNATKRHNLFNQTDVTRALQTGRIRHTLLGGTELGLQFTDNFRNTGFFNNTTTTISVPYANGVTDTPVTFRQAATDADNHLVTKVAAVYTQDQIELSEHLQLIGGLRFDYFDLKYHNNRTNETLRRIDRLLSPRAGAVYKPVTPLSIYGSYSISYLPSSGDQFSSLTTITQQVKPEKFNNYEAGVKWDVLRNLSLTTALFRLDRLNTRATDPTDPTRIIQTGSTRTNGYELGVSGRMARSWQIAGGYAYQKALIRNATTAAVAGASVAQVPRHTFSLWNHYQITRRLGAGIGVMHRTDMFAAVDNSVVLPGYTRVDAAVYYGVTAHLRLQVNAENLANLTYYVNADSNNNISPGLPRTIRVGLTTSF